MTETVLFLCPHNAAKSVIAAAYFNRQAEEAGLPFVADSAGTEPSAAVSPVVVAMLREESIDVGQFQPRHVTADELSSVAHIVSMGCTPEELNIAPQRIKDWSDVPPVSEDPQASRKAILAHVTLLVNDLRQHP